MTVKFLVGLPLRLLDLIARAYGLVLSSVRPHWGYIWAEFQTNKISQQVEQVAHVVRGQAYSLKFHTPNFLCHYRATTLSTKEPETLAWIDQYGDSGAFFDIGANIGLYSAYFATTKTGNVYAFEPSVFNLALLAKNLNANGIEQRVRIISSPLTETNQFADFNLSSLEEGGALSAFGVNYGHDGLPLHRIFAYQTLGFTLDFLIEQKIILEIPKMIKIDVDGIEHLILKGAIKTISNPVCRTILLEVPDDFSAQSKEVERILSDCGFFMANRKSPDVPIDLTLTSGFNQIWIK